MVNKLLEVELKDHIHALSIQAKTIEQWETNPIIYNTPNCAGNHTL